MGAFGKRDFTKYLLLFLLSAAIAITGACSGAQKITRPMIPKNNIPADTDADVKKEIERLYSSKRQRKKGANNLAEMGKRAAPAAPFLMELLRDDNDGVREHAALALGKVKDPRAVEPLIEALKVDDEDDDVRRNIVFALGDIGDPSAAEALGKIRDPRAIEPLIAALPLIAEFNFQEKLIGKNAAWSLGKIGDPRAVKPLIIALKDEEKGVKGQAVMGYVIGGGCTINR
ncbi:MAG: HEAT repeat domain-containing protein [Nitrospirae bacterium]|nr:HEAT repeat domain-containing protein [Nitrospirota bacterium]